MKKAIAIIGANFGDEGKGVITDFISSITESNVVVRYNGGAQAGHTVVTPDNKRHVFSHFGSGSFCDTPTYLSKYFIVNPFLLQKEQKILYPKIGSVTLTGIDADCLVTTSYDMMLNQMIEASRGSSCHGSCGVGVFETICRHKEIPLTYKDFLDARYVREALIKIRTEYLPARLSALGLSIPSIFKDLTNPYSSPHLDSGYIRDMESVLDTYAILKTSAIKDFSTFIFEGAQGLLLDQDNMPYFPNLTPSNTGLKNVVSVLNELREVNVLDGFSDDYDLEVIYVTRCYMTRHGAGTFVSETKDKPYKNIEDLTNIVNEYQGKLRFGILDMDLMIQSIKKDLRDAPEGCKVSLAVTCLDQVSKEEGFSYIKEGILVTGASITEFMHDITSLLDFFNVYQSFGPTRKTIKFL